MVYKLHSKITWPNPAEVATENTGEGLNLLRKVLNVIKHDTP